MRVCFFIPSLGDGGAQRQCIALLNELQHVQGIELHLIVLAAGEHERSLDVSSLKLHRTEVRNFASFKALLFVVRTLRRERPDLLVSWLHPADILAYLATRIVRGVRWVMTERDSAYPDELIYNVRKRTGHSADIIIANSRQGQAMWKSIAPSSRVLQIPNISLVRPAIQENHDGRSASAQCIFVGRLEPQKNVRMLAEAFAHFATGEASARLIVVGRGSEANSMREVLQRHSLEQRADFVGFRHDVPELMARSRVLLSLSRHEGMPNVVMEAVATGLLVVVSNIPEHRALLGDDYPYFVDLDSPSAEAAAIIDKAWNGDLPPNMDVYSHAYRVLAAMTPTRIAAEYLSIFSEMFSCGKSPSPKTEKEPAWVRNLRSR